MFVNRAAVRKAVMGVWAVLSILLMFQGKHVEQVIWLALIQGITEFLPVSSSAHLVLFPQLTDWPDQGLAFDCIVHLGSLAAVMVYFRQDILRMLAGGSQCIRQRSLNDNADGKLLFLILLATVPVCLAGLLFRDMVETELRSLTVIAWASIGFGVLLWLSDALGEKVRSGERWRVGQALWVGGAQVLALIPGTSRSGVTMTVALMLGFTRAAAARFSFLLSIPVIALAALLKFRDWLAQPETYMTAADLLLGFVLSAVSTYYCITLFLGFIERMGVQPFVIYRIVLGVFLLALV